MPGDWDDGADRNFLTRRYTESDCRAQRHHREARARLVLALGVGEEFNQIAAGERPKRLKMRRMRELKAAE